jgi:hypothetical protein
VTCDGVPLSEPGYRRRASYSRNDASAACSSARSFAARSSTTARHDSTVSVNA